METPAAPSAVPADDDPNSGAAVFRRLPVPHSGLRHVDRNAPAMLEKSADIVLCSGVAGLGERQPVIVGGAEVTVMIGFNTGLEGPDVGRHAGRRQRQNQHRYNRMSNRTIHEPQHIDLNCSCESRMARRPSTGRLTGR